MKECNKCEHFLKIDKKVETGECRRFPPTMRSFDDTDRFPVVWDTDGCGEFKKISKIKGGKQK